MKTADSKEPSELVFRSVASSFVRQLYRMRASDAALFRMIATYAEYIVHRPNLKDCSCVASHILLENFAKIAPETVNILDQEYSRSTVITAISLVDSFLADVLRLLLLKFPNAIPKERQVRVTEILSAPSHDELVSQLVEKYVREISYQSLSDRIGFLEAKFGVKGIDDAALLSRLFQHAELRNSLVHDLSSYKYGSRGTEIIAASKIDRPKVKWEHAERVVDDSIAVIETIFGAVTLHVYGKRMSIRVKA